MTINIKPASKNESNVVFFDDFNAGELGRSIWNVEVTGKVHNNEQQAYIDSPETLYIQKEHQENANGVLVIHPRYRKGFVTPQGKTFDFTSGRINTQGRVEFTYGSVSARILLPVGVGLWPAFWLLGSSGEWPNCGELDILEYVTPVYACGRPGPYPRRTAPGSSRCRGAQG